jgi:purine-nucleoside phosphorylase
MDVSLENATRFIRQARPGFQPRVGLVLGSGLGPLADQIESPTKFNYREIPGFPLSHVPGHAGKLVLGQLRSVPVIAMQGRSHLYEGWSIEQATLPIETMAELGIELLIVSNASGGINLRFQSGQIVLIDSHINFLSRKLTLPRPTTPIPLAHSGPIRSANVYDQGWIQRAQRAAVRLGFSLATGTYLATLGPNYETRAEYRAFARMGADMVGMSTVPEVLVAARRQLPVLAFSIITNVANPDAPTQTDHADVLDWSTSAQQQLLPLIEVLLSDTILPLGPKRG